MNTKHTSGKFSIYENAPGNKHRFIIHDSAGQTIATTTGDPDHAPDYYRALANARLFAAAPDLLAVLEEIVKSIDFERGASETEDAERLLIAARAAIAKATGEA